MHNNLEIKAFQPYIWECDIYNNYNKDYIKKGHKLLCEKYKSRTRKGKNTTTNIDINCQVTVTYLWCESENTFTAETKKKIFYTFIQKNNPCTKDISYPCHKSIGFSQITNNKYNIGTTFVKPNISNNSTKLQLHTFYQRHIWNPSSKAFTQHNSLCVGVLRYMYSKFCFQHNIIASLL